VSAFDGRTDEEVLATYLDDSRRSAEREVAFHELVTRYQRRVFAVCFRVLGTAADAEDAAQETFIKLARNADGFRGEAKLSTWLYRVANNVCLDRLRYERRRPSTPVDDLTAIDQAPTVEDATDAHLAAHDVRNALALLDELSRRLLLLVAVDGLSYAEAAEVADLPVGTVKSRVSRARVKLGVLLETHEDEADGDPAGARSEPTGGRADPPAASGPRGPP
jgi:RNA polymerase sigma-70 factor, ECF subfamily